MKRLKLLREENHLTQSKLGSEIGFTQQAIAGYENGRNYPSVKTLCAFADYFNTTADYLLERTDYSLRPDYDGSRVLSKEEADILNNYRSLENEHRKYISSSIALLRESESKYSG